MKKNVPWPLRSSCFGQFSAKSRVLWPLRSVWFEAIFSQKSCTLTPPISLISAIFNQKSCTYVLWPLDLNAQIWSKLSKHTESKKTSAHREVEWIVLTEIAVNINVYEFIEYYNKLMENYTYWEFDFENVTKLKSP